MTTASFFVDHGFGQLKEPGRKLQAQWDRAKEICEFCPVKRECARDSLGEHEGVWGGLDPAERTVLRKVLSAQVRRMEGPHKQEYAELAHRLRMAHKYQVRDVARIMGISESTVSHLVDWHNDYMASQPQETAKVITLELPGIPKAPWPVKDPEDGEAWVRYQGSVVRGYYLGQTEDDTWFFMKVPLSKEYSAAWFKAEDVQMRREASRNVRRRVGNESRIYGTPLSRYSEDVKQAG